MAKANPANLNPQAPEADGSEPEIVYLGKSKDMDIKFDVNPKASKYVVNENGTVLEYLK